MFNEWHFISSTQIVFPFAVSTRNGTGFCEDVAEHTFEAVEVFPIDPADFGLIFPLPAPLFVGVLAQ